VPAVEMMGLGGAGSHINPLFELASQTSEPPYLSWLHNNGFRWFRRNLALWFELPAPPSPLLSTAGTT